MKRVSQTTLIPKKEERTLPDLGLLLQRQLITMQREKDF